MLFIMCVSTHLSSSFFRTPGLLHCFRFVFASLGLAKVLLIHAGVGCSACAQGLQLVVPLVGVMFRKVFVA